MVGSPIKELNMPSKIHFQYQPEDVFELHFSLLYEVGPIPKRGCIGEENDALGKSIRQAKEKACLS